MCLVATSLEKCVNASEQIPGSVPVQADLLKEEDIQRLYQETGDVDILALNASIQYKRAWDAYDEDDCNLLMSSGRTRKNGKAVLDPYGYCIMQV